LNEEALHIHKMGPLDAIKKGDAQGLTFYLKSGGNPDRDLDNKSLLMAAVHAGRNNLVKILLDHGARVDERDSFGNTALMIACRTKTRLKIARTLLTGGADSNCKVLLSKIRSITRSFLYGAAPLHLAVIADSIKLVNMLVRHKARVNAVDPVSKKTALHIAAEMGRARILKLLLNRGAVFNLHQQPGSSFLELALGNSKGKRIIRYCARRFLQKVSSPPFPGLTRSLSSLTSSELYLLSFLAIATRRLGLAESLIKYGQRIFTGKAKRHLCGAAIRFRRTSLAGLLLQSGADVNVVDRNGRTLLHDAAQQGFPNIVAMLVRVGANPNAEITSYGVTPLHLTKNVKCARLLINADADINYRDAFDQTPLHYAINEEKIEVAKLLINNNHSIDLNDTSGGDILEMVGDMTPKNRDIIIELLQEKVPEQCVDWWAGKASVPSTVR
jgi:ankyrin repeat protein